VPETAPPGEIDPLHFTSTLKVFELSFDIDSVHEQDTLKDPFQPKMIQEHPTGETPCMTLLNR
jgi:hypothetical protein